MKWSAKYRTHSPQSPPHPGIPSEAGGSWINTRHGGINMSVKSPNTQCLWVGRASKGKVAYESNKREACRGLHTVNSILHYKGRGGRALLSSKSKCLLGTLRSLKGLFAGEATTIARVRREQKGHTQTMRLGRREGKRGRWRMGTIRGSHFSIAFLPLHNPCGQREGLPLPHKNTLRTYCPR